MKHYTNVLFLEIARTNMLYNFLIYHKKCKLCQFLRHNETNGAVIGAQYLVMNNDVSD